MFRGSTIKEMKFPTSYQAAIIEMEIRYLQVLSWSLRFLPFPESMRLDPSIHLFFTAWERELVELPSFHHQKTVPPKTPIHRWRVPDLTSSHDNHHHHHHHHQHHHHHDLHYFPDQLIVSFNHGPPKIVVSFRSGNKHIEEPYQTPKGLRPWCSYSFHRDPRNKIVQRLLIDFHVVLPWKKICYMFTCFMKQKHWGMTKQNPPDPQTLIGQIFCVVHSNGQDGLNVGHIFSRFKRIVHNKERLTSKLLRGHDVMDLFAFWPSCEILEQFFVRTYVCKIGNENE